MRIRTNLNREFVVDPYLTPIQPNVYKHFEQIDETFMVGNINGKIYSNIRTCPEVFGGRVIKVKELFVIWLPLNRQFPVCYRIRKDWNEPLSEKDIS